TNPIFYCLLSADYRLLLVIVRCISTPDGYTRFLATRMGPRTKVAGTRHINSVGNPSVSTITAEPSIQASPKPKAPPAKRWLFGPWVDALLIANIAWPLLVLLQAGEGFGSRPGLQFWQVYYVTTPHRWITLAIVFLDRERFRERRRMFLG